MKAIRQRFISFGIFTGLATAISILLIIDHISAREFKTSWLLTASCLAGGLLAGLWIREYGNLKIARLIFENRIVYIRSAVIKNIAGGEAEYGHVEGVEVFISNFGILLDSRIIKFNQGGAQLKAVELGSNFISLAYGTEKRTQKIWLLSDTFSDRELGDIVEKFSFETGVVPVIIDQ